LEHFSLDVLRNIYERSDMECNKLCLQTFRNSQRSTFILTLFEVVGYEVASL
jgi:hypothetical protein